MKNNDWWSWLWDEARAILVVAGSITAGLWIRRTVERLVSSGTIDKTVVDHGIAPPPPPAPAPERPTTNGSVIVPRSTLFDLHRPKPYRRGAGSVMVEDRWTGRQVRVWYQGAVEDRNGLVLYEHDDMLSPHHRWPCPPLKVNTACTDCDFYVDRGPYLNDPMCAAVEKLTTCPDDWERSVQDIHRSLAWG